MGMALRGYYRSDRHDDPFIESHLDIRDAEGNVVPGYGWIFPMGDGRVNVGVGLLSTDQRWKGLNTSHLMDAFVDFAPASWGLRPETSLGPPTGGKLPMGLSVGPRAGGNVLITGDAGGAINPFNGEGIAYGYETGRLAAAALGHALTGEGERALTDYDRELTAAYGPYFKVARAFVHLISNPEAMRLCVGLGMRSELLMTQLLRIMANLMRPDAAGPAELGFRAMELVSRLLPDDDGLETPPPEPGRLSPARWPERPIRRTAAPRRSATRSSHAALFALEALGDAGRGGDAHPGVERHRRQGPAGPGPRGGRRAGTARPARSTAAPTGPACGPGRPPRPAATVSQSMTTQPSGPTSTLEGWKSKWQTPRPPSSSSASNASSSALQRDVGHARLDLVAQPGHQVGQAADRRSVARAAATRRSRRRGDRSPRRRRR